MLEISNGNPKAKAIINCEDLATLGAALGCSFGIFRFPITGKRPQGDPDIFNAGLRKQKKRMDEVTRSVRWHRIALPFPANAQPVLVDSVLLSDKMTIKKGETWDWDLQSPLIQSAPARITRGLPLPIVVAKGDVPFVVAARYPNEAVSVGTFGRFSDKEGYKFPMADITQKLGKVPPAIGIFGQYKSLTFTFDKSIEGKKVLAQDLAGSKATDVTKQVSIKGNTLMLPGSLIARIGLQASTPGDLSDPGLIIVIK